MTGIAICVPSGDHVHAEFARCLASMVGHVASTGAGRLGVFSGRSSIVAVSRNICVQAAINADLDWLMFLDSDMTFPVDTVHRLLAHDKDIVGATYMNRTPPHQTHGCTASFKPVEVSTGLVEMHTMPTGCLLIRRTVFDQFPKPWFRFGHDEKSGTMIGEDILFCLEARRKGFQIWCDVDLTLELGHMGTAVYRIPGEEEAKAAA